MQTGAPFKLAAANLGAGWNLVATGNDVTPSAFNISLTTLWAWDYATSSWYFYAPALDANGTLASYITIKGYRSFGIKTLGNGMGFWVNGPSGNAADTPPVVGADLQAPTIPAGLTATAASSFPQVNLAWAASTDNVGVTQYKIYRDGALLTTLGTVTNYSDSGLAPATTYSYTVAACDAAGNCSAQSIAAAAITVPDTQAPTIPAGLTATAVNGTQINLMWTASTDNVGVTQYKVYRGGVLLTPVGGAGTSYSDSGLTTATTYSYTVAACDAAGNCTAQSIAATATTPDTQPPTIPAGLIATASSGSQINLVWTASTDNVGVTQYKVYRGGALLATLGAATSYSDNSLTTATTYSYTVAACDAAGNCTAQSIAATATTPDTQPPTIPAGLIATASSGSQVNLMWTASTDNVGVTQYKVYRGGVLLTPVGGAVTSYSDSGLNAGTTYNYTVTACDAAGNCSAQSASADLSISLLERGWNLLGNSLNQPFTVATLFGDPALVSTVWKWDTTTSGWQFYTPSLTPADLQTYVTSKGYGLLSVVNPGEGYWVNAKLKTTLATQTGAPFYLGAANLVKGWNLVATNDGITPSAFNISLGATPPATGVVPGNLITLWAWDNLLGTSNNCS